MNIRKVSANNFQSYSVLDFDFRNHGLCLISGATGAGKSTVMDLVTWTLFGHTGKDSNAADVTPWTGGSVQAQLELMINNSLMAVIRSRDQAKVDLQIVIDGRPTRGRDIKDTQKMLIDYIGMDLESFLASAYLTQLSRADSFFIATAKDRREVLENLVDQTFAITIGDKASAKRKVTKEAITGQETAARVATAQINAVEGQLESLKKARDSWDEAQAKRRVAAEADFKKKNAEHTRRLLAAKTEKATLQEQLITPEYIDQAIADIDRDYSLLRAEMTKSDKKCPTCKQNIKSDEHEQERIQLIDDRQSLQNAKNDNFRYQTKINSLDLEIAQLLKNPPIKEELTATSLMFDIPIAEAAKKLKEYTIQASAATANTKVLRTELSALNWLYDASLTLRGVLLTQVVAQIERSTNDYLERFFEARLRIKLSIQDQDRVDVEISNGGYVAPFRQLSGGERCMLKLCFSLSVMKAAQNKAGQKMNMIMLDEPLNGLDEELKLKSFSLLQELEKEYESVFVIEHSENLKNQFTKSFEVVKVNGESTIREQAT